MYSETPGFLVTALGILFALFIFVIGLAVIGLVVVYVIDVAQTKHTIRRSYPIVGHF